MTKLFGNPKQDPKYAISLETGRGVVKVSDPRAMRSWIALMDMFAVHGGAASHFGGPSALVELLSTLHAWMFEDAKKSEKTWNELYHLINDAGHCENAFYALKANYNVAGINFNDLKKFRSIESPLTGHGEVHCFPEGVFLSNGPLGSAFPQSQGLAMADKKLGNSRVTVSIISDGASMEGEAKEAFAAIPGLAKRGLMNPFLAVISDNNTKLSGRIDHESFSMTPTFQSLSVLGWEVVTLESAHDLQKCWEAFQKCFGLLHENPSRPVALHAKTIKGYGTKKTADSASGAHGFPLKKSEELRPFLQEIYGNEKVPAEFFAVVDELQKIENDLKSSGGGEKIQVGVSKALINARKDQLPVVSITSDLPGSTGVADFRKAFPADSFDVGVAEANMVSVATGFSKSGFIPVVDTFAQFGVTKGALPLIMANLSEAPVIAMYSHTGFQDAADGASHQALSYLAMTCSVPHTHVYTLSSSEEAESIVGQALREFHDEKKAGRMPPSTIFFLGRENFPKTYADGMKYELRKSQVLFDSSADHGTSVAIYASGSLVGEAMKAAHKLKEKNVGAIVVHPSCMKPFDGKTLKDVVGKTKGNVITLDDHQTVGGLGSLLSLEAHQQGLAVRMKALGVDDEFGRSSYTAIELYEKHGLCSESVVSAASELLG